MRTNDYKQSKVFTCMTDGTIREETDLLKAIDGYFKHNNKNCLYVTFNLKRRQTVSSWRAQICRAVLSRLSYINDARRKAGLEAFTATTLADSLLFREETDGDTVKLVLWERIL